MLKPDSHIPCRSPAVLKPDSHISCRSHAVLKPDSHIPCRSPAVLKPDSHTPCRSPAVLKPDSHIPCHDPAILLLLITNFLELRVVAERRRKLAGRRSYAVRMPSPCREPAVKGIFMAGERHGNGMVCVTQTRPHCVNQMGKSQFKPLAERHGRGTAWYL